MVNLLYSILFGEEEEKYSTFDVMTESRELSNYCQESVRPAHSRRYVDAFQHLEEEDSKNLIANVVIADNARRAINGENSIEEREINQEDPAYLQVMDFIEQGV